MGTDEKKPNDSRGDFTMGIWQIQALFFVLKHGKKKRIFSQGLDWQYGLSIKQTDV